MSVARETTTARVGRVKRVHVSAAKTARTAEAVAESRIRTRGVGTLKVALAVAAVAIVGLVLAWPSLLPDDKRVRLGGARKVGVEDADTLKMINARYVGLDEQNRPFVVTATRAVDGRDDGLVHLEQPKADLINSDGGWTAVTANTGLLRRETHKLELVGDVNLYHDSGLEIHSESAHVDLATHDSWGDMPVQGQDPGMRFDGEAFHTTDHGVRVFLSKKSHVTLYQGGGAGALARRDPTKSTPPPIEEGAP